VARGHRPSPNQEVEGHHALVAPNSDSSAWIVTIHNMFGIALILFILQEMVS